MRELGLDRAARIPAVMMSLMVEYWYRKILSESGSQESAELSLAHLDLLERCQASADRQSGTNTEHGIGIKCLFEFAGAIFSQELKGGKKQG